MVRAFWRIVVTSTRPDVSFSFPDMKERLRPGEYIPPKKMIEFSRQHQEEKLVRAQEDELRMLTEDEVDLEVRPDNLVLTSSGSRGS